jgi:3-phosphoshikimate 1-carboxyvinyltransferase
MGGNIVTENQKLIAGEPFGDIVVRSSELTNINIPGELIPNIIDEIPVLSIAGILTDGEFKIKNASELRGKESDRITAVCQNLKILGLKVEEYEDGYQVSGQIKNDSPVFESFGDHRIAMSFGILSLLLKKGGKINNFDCVNISNPDFINQIKKIASF